MIHELDFDHFRWARLGQPYDELCEAEVRLIDSGLLDPKWVWEFISLNIHRLVAEGLFEAALAYALNLLADCVCPDHDQDQFIRLIGFADPEKLQAAGSQLPGPGPFTIYRIVDDESVGRHRFRLAWHMSLEAVCRLACYSKPRGKILSATIDAKQILCFANKYSQQDVIAFVFESSRLEIDDDEINRLARQSYYPH